MITRRDFVQSAALSAAYLGLPLHTAEQVMADVPPPVPRRELLGQDPDSYWSQLRRQWLLTPGQINLNCGSVGCTPVPVLRATIDHLLSCERFQELGYPWFGYEEKSIIRQLRDALAGFLHCKRDELALVRNATEANNIVCHGLDLKAGDEVVLTDQEHVGGRCCWEQRAARHGIRLRYVTLPRPPASTDEILARFSQVLGARTRVLAFSHITSPTGLILPAKEICGLARGRGILSHVDGAHAIGQIHLDLHDLGCDFYATSPHKWLLAPKGTGTLFVREEQLDRLWVHTASGDWDNKALKAYRFSNLGTSNLSVIVGLRAALDFYEQIGPALIYKRIHELAGRIRAQVKRFVQLRLSNASADPFYAGMVSFEPEQGDLKEIVAQFAARKIRISGGAKRIRIATHIFTQPSEIQTFADALDKALPNST
jgi:isopenicillin-N epimerase